MQRSLHNILTAVLLFTLLLSTTSYAATINGSLLEYQDANGSFVARSVDFISFSTPGGAFTFDMLASEQPDGLDDPMLWLFNDDGQLDASDWLAENDDSDFAHDGNQDGSLNELDSFLSLVIAAGNYKLAIGTGGDFGGTDLIDGLQLESSPFSSGLPAVSSLKLNYQLTITGDMSPQVTPVPVPAAGYLMLSGLGLVWLRRRARRS